MAVWAKSANNRGASCSLQKFGDRPCVICNVGLHCRSDAKGAMNATKVVPSEIQGQSRFQVSPFLREGVGESRQSANLHPHGQVLTLYMRCANPFRIGLSPNWFRRGLYHFCWRIAVLVFTGRSIDFYKLCEIDPCSKTSVDGINVRRETIGGDL